MLIHYWVQLLKVCVPLPCGVISIPTFQYDDIVQTLFPFLGENRLWFTLKSSRKGGSFFSTDRTVIYQCSTLKSHWRPYWQAMFTATLSPYISVCEVRLLASRQFLLSHIDSTDTRLRCSIWHFLWRCGPTRAIVSSFLRCLDHTQRRTTVGRTPLDEWSARRRDLYPTTHDTQNRQTSMPRRNSNPQSQQASACRPTP